MQFNLTIVVHFHNDIDVFNQMLLVSFLFSHLIPIDIMTRNSDHLSKQFKTFCNNVEPKGLKAGMLKQRENVNYVTRVP